MRRTLPIAAALLAIATAGTGAPGPRGYLPPGTVDITRILPPPPARGDIRARADGDIFRATRPLAGGARWIAATADVPTDATAILADFSCAAGLTLDPATAPATARLIDRASADTGLANNAAKEHWRYPRPFVAGGGPTCQAPETLGASFDYPSGHTTRGWTVGLILAALLPDRATPILTRARAYGESRIACRVHNASAVEAGRLGASAVMAAVRETPAFAADLAAAKAEMARLRGAATAPDASRCAAEAALLSPSVLDGLRR